MGAWILLVISIFVILAGALLFTNAVEWLGHRLDIGQGAVGSLLAAVSTAMPETFIPAVALIGGAAGAKDVAIGAIIGAPFLLATLAMMLVGVAAMAYSGRRVQGRHLSLHVPTLERDLLFFMVFFGLALLLGVVDTGAWVRYGMVVILVLAYGAYIRRTWRAGGLPPVDMEPLVSQRILDRVLGSRSAEHPSTTAIVVQFVVGLGVMIAGAHTFVVELLDVAEAIGVSALVLALVIAPFATELPEKANSFIWVRSGKDTLALGNITGAMVFQSTLAVAIGLAFTGWSLSTQSVLPMALGLAGGAMAYWALRIHGQFNWWAVAAWGALYAVFIGYVAMA